jgi:hypothetical protein
MVELKYKDEGCWRESMASRKVWEPFESVFCQKIMKSVSGEIQVLIHTDTSRRESKPTPTGMMDCSGESECRVVNKEKDCPIFQAFCAFLKS